nr:INneXin family member (inx 1) [Hymenolepis microstoma]
MVYSWRGSSKGCRSDSMVMLEDFSDRLNRKYTSSLLLLLGAITMVNIYFVRPISCDIQTLPKRTVRYAEAVCWNQGTMIWEKISEENGSQRSPNVSFYQWVPFCLVIQAILFYLPHFIWHALLNWSFGDSFSYLISRTKAAAMTGDVLSRANLVRACADQLYLLPRQNFSSITSLCWSFQECLRPTQTRRGGSTVEKRTRHISVVCYLLIKVLYILNCGSQAILALCLLVQDNLVQNAVTTFSERHNDQVYTSRYFPHTGWCSFRVLSWGIQSHFFTVSCALPLNVFNENIYLFLSLWFLLVLSVTVSSTIIWMHRLVMRSHRNDSMKNFLCVSLLNVPFFRVSDATDLNIMSGRAHYEPANLDKALIEKFLTEEVGCDGSFIINIMRLNAGDVVTGEVLVTWWRMFRGSESTNDDGEINYIDPTNLQLRTFAEVNGP